MTLRKWKKRFYPPPSLYIKQGCDVVLQEMVALKILGQGGCKRALLLDNGKAILVPNMDVDPWDTIQSRWPRIVDEEIQMSQFLQKVGLLGPQLQKVQIFSEKDSTEGIPGYMTDAFDTLKEKNIYIIDRKNFESDTWTGNQKLFENREDAKNPKN